MARRLIGLDVGTNAVTIAEVTPGSPPRLDMFAQVAKVLSVAPHPNADRLRVCEVDVGAASRSPSSAARRTSAPA